MLKTEFIGDIGTIQSYLQEKVWETGKISDVMGREKKLNFGNKIIEILAAQSYCPSECEVLEVLVLGGVPKGKPIVAIKLPKL